MPRQEANVTAVTSQMCLTKIFARDYASSYFTSRLLYRLVSSVYVWQQDGKNGCQSAKGRTMEGPKKQQKGAAGGVVVTFVTLSNKREDSKFNPCNF
jgi:hypothetical protein